MSRARILLLAGSLGLLSLAPVEAQTFHELYGRTYQFGELTSVASISVPGAIASGYFVDGAPQGVVFKVLPTGALAWVRAYGPTLLSAVREASAGFAWIGTGEQPRSFMPVVAGVDPVGAVLWARAIRLVLPNGAPADQAYGRFLEVDPKDGGYWVGGEVWLPGTEDSQPWLGKLDGKGNLLWAKTLGFGANARFHSIFPAREGGIIGVGQLWAQDDSGRMRSGMLAVRLGPGGDFVWGFRYHVQNAVPGGEQRLSDVDRDPRYERSESVVVGTVAAFCKSLPSVPCDPVESAAFVALLDETTGKLSQARGLFSMSRPKTFGETIVMDLTGETIVVGGEVEGNGQGSRQGLLALLSPGLDIARPPSLHGAGAGFDAEVRSLDRWRDDDDHRGYIFAMNQTYASPTTLPIWLRSLVRTDRDGHSGACEQGTEARTFKAWIYEGEVQPELRDGRAELFPVQAMPIDLVEEPCGRPHPPGRR